MIKYLIGGIFIISFPGIMLESKQPMKQLQSFNTREQQREMVKDKVIISVM
jgi:hypothetical protein